MKLLVNLHRWLGTQLDYAQPLALLGARIYVAWVFFASGLTKIRDWDSTLLLFQYEYQVPLLSPEMAAYAGTAGELFLPILLVLGLFGRIGAIGISIVNVMAVLSLEEIAPAAYNQHLIWGALAAMVVVWGAGKLSLDHFLEKRYA